jgi:hypothetical protein
MAHYFDDMFHKLAHEGRPRTPSMPRIRRSSTYLSREDEVRYRDDDEDQTPTRTPAQRSRAASITNSDRIREKIEADKHMQAYVRQQLQRVQSRTSIDQYEGDDEIEAKGTTSYFD